MTNENHPAAVPIGFSFKPKPRRKVWNRTYRQCDVKAPCGLHCTPNGNSPHSFHSCKNVECQACHGDQRFRFGGQR